MTDFSHLKCTEHDYMAIYNLQNRINLNTIATILSLSPNGNHKGWSLTQYYFLAVNAQLALLTADFIKTIKLCTQSLSSSCQSSVRSIKQWNQDFFQMQYFLFYMLVSFFCNMFIFRHFRFAINDLISSIKYTCSEYNSTLLQPCVELLGENCKI